MKEGRRSWMQSGSMRKRWFVSYLLVLAVPLLLCLILYGQAYRTIRAESEEMYNSALEQVRIDMDAYLNEVEQVFNQTLLNTYIQKSTRIGTVMQPEDQLMTVDIRDEIQHTLLGHPNISSVSLLLNMPDGVVCSSGYMSQPVYYKLYCQSDSFTQEQFQDYMRQPHNLWDMVSLQCSDGKRFLLFSRTTIDNSYGKNTGTVVVTIDLTMLRQRLQQFCWDERLHFYIVASDQPVCQTIGSSPLELSYNELEQGNSLRMVQNNGVPSGMLVKESAVSGWRYVLLVEEGLLRQSAVKIQLYTFFGLLVCMLVGLALSSWLSQRNFHPILQMISRFSSQEGAVPPNGENEYAQLDRYIEDFFNKRGSEQHALWNSQQALHKYQLYTLLERPCRKDMPDGESRLLQSRAFLVVVFSLPQQTGNIGADLLQFAVINIFEEVAGAHFTLEMTHASENVAAIIAMPVDQEDMPGALEEDIRFTQQQIQEHFHLAVAAAAGDPHPDIEGIHYSYQEALEAVSYQRAGQETDLVFYRDIRDISSSYTFPLDEERKLIDLIAAGKSGEARQVVEQAFTNHLHQGVQSASVARCLAYDVMSALIKGGNLAGVNELSVVRFVEIEHCPSTELPAKLGDFVDLLCEKIHKQEQQTTPVSQLCRDVSSFIRENYQNPDLNISQTGLHFDLTPAYLSALFKKETGESLLGFITQVRLDAAKKLLMQGQSVTHIAEQCGFRDSSTLIRVFKKSTGLTPGQYKNIHMENESPPSQQ